MFCLCENLTFIDISSFHRNKTEGYTTFLKIPEKGKIFVSNDYYDYIKKVFPEWEIFIR